ncbi:hypothetical protein AGMMS49975_27850 [Clostridia bacterium]|nr:hypothetical protein AGMMS49975_27850 [Clostridia bacterium]
MIGKTETRLKEIFYEIAKEKDVEIKALEIMPDHVHMFISFDPRQPLHELIFLFRGRSSHHLREEFSELKRRLPSLWTRSYFCCTIGHISEETIQKRRYSVMKQSKSYQANCKKEKGTERNKIFRELNKQYGLEEYALHSYIRNQQKHFKENIDSFAAQKIAARAWNAF